MSVRYGRLFARQGIDELEGITLAHTEDITGLGVFIPRANAAHILLRMSATIVEELDPVGNTWDDVTGTALTGTALDRPQFFMHKSNLTMTNEGNNRPRLFAGTGQNTTELGGTPPFARALSGLLDFLFLGNVSDDGTFTDLTNGPRTIRYSDDFNNDWTLCDGNEIILTEIRGEILAMHPIGRGLIAYGSTDLAAVRFVGGAVRFAHDRISFNGGILAPLSVGAIDADTQIFLANDAELYVTNGSQVTALPPAVIDTLQETMDITNARQAFSVVDNRNEVYNLYYPTSAADTWMRGRLAYNYRSKEFYNYVYDGHEFSRGVFMRFDDAQAQFMAVSGATDANPDLVFTMDTGQDDNGTRIDSFWDTDWQTFNTLGDKYLTGITVIADRNAQSRLAISFAHNYETRFRRRRTFSLKGRRPTDTDAVVTYKFPSPILGRVFNARLNMFNDGSIDQTAIRAIGFHYLPINASVREGVTNISPDSSVGGADQS